jgi:hypothetical protein
MSITIEKLPPEQIRNKIQALKIRLIIAMDEAYKAHLKLAQIKKELERVQHEQCPHSHATSGIGDAGFACECPDCDKNWIE